MKVSIVCAHCRMSVYKESDAVNRARRNGAPTYCSRQCAGLARRVERSADERKQRKAEYDALYRTARADVLREKKREYFQRSYDADAAREKRKSRMPYHVAYCRRYYADPVKRREKFAYDVRLRGRQYAEFAEAWRLLIELEREVRSRCPDKYERQKGRGYFTRIQERKHRDRQERRQSA